MPDLRCPLRRIFGLSLFLILCLLVLAPSVRAQGTESQAISFLPISDRAVNTAPFQVVALSSSYLPVTLQVQGPASLNGRLVTLTGVGTVTVIASQAGNADYAPTTAQLSFKSLAITPTLAVDAVSVPYGTPSSGYQFQGAATASPYVDPSADTTTVTTQLTASVLNPGGPPSYPASSPVFRYEGPTVAPSPYPGDYGGYRADAEPYPYGINFKIAFTCDCSEFEIQIQSRAVFYRLWVDGSYTSPESTQTPAAFPEPAFILVQFPDKRPRQIKITDMGNAPFYGIDTANGDTLSSAQVPIGPAVMIFGDSWTGPTILPPLIGPAQPGLTGSGYPQTLGEYFNWDYWDDGVGGSGFTVPGIDVLSRTFVQRIETDLCPYPFQSVVLLGGTNDGAAAEAPMQSAVSTALSEIRSCEAASPIYLYGPQNTNQPQTHTAMAAAAAAAVGPLTYTDIGMDQWFYGDPSDPSTGNEYLYLNGHPTPLGHDFLAEMIAANLVHAFPQLLPQPYALFTPTAVAGSYSASPVSALAAPGSYPVTETFQPADTAHFTAATATTTLTITQATTITDETVGLNNGVATLTSTVAPQIAGVPTGSVTFTDDTAGQVLGVEPLVNGVSTLQISLAKLTPGSHSVSADYGGDADFLPSSMAMPVSFIASVPDFTFAIGQSSLTLTPGSSGTLPLDVTPLGGLTGRLSVQCTGLPQNATCSLSGTPTLSGVTLNATLTIEAYTNTASLTPNERTPWWPVEGAGAFCCLLGWLPLWRRRRAFAGYAAMFALCALAAGCGGLLSGCGSTSAIHDATPGAYTVQVALTVNGGTSAAVTHTELVTLNLP